MSELIRAYKKIMDNINDGVYFVDNGRRILFWNSAAEIITGYKKDEIEGKYCWNNILSHIDEEGNELCMTGCPLEKSLLDGNSRSVTIYLRHKEGYRIPVMVKAIPMFEKNGDIVGAVEIFNSLSSYNKIEMKNNIMKEYGVVESEIGIFNSKYMEKCMISKINLFNSENISNYFAIFQLEINSELENSNYKKLLMKTILNNIDENDIIGIWDEKKIGIIFNNSKDDGYQKMNILKNLIKKTYADLESKEKSSTISAGVTKIKSGDNFEIVKERLESLLEKAKKSREESIIFE